MVVSIMVRGAGSVAVSARPILPNTVFTSGTVLIMRSDSCRSSAALPGLKPGRVVGMESRSPSSRGGMNSEPSLEKGYNVAASMSAPAKRPDMGKRRAKASNGW
jgi:hypothetical protein